MSYLAAIACSLVAMQTGAFAAESKAAPPGDRIVLLVDEIKQIRSFPVVLAERLGYFADEGVPVTVMNIRDDVPYFDMLLDGRIDAVMAYYHHNIVAQSQGKDFEAVATLGVTPGIKVLVANRVRDKYKTSADLEGARIIAGGAGSSKTTIANYLLIAGGHAIADYTRLATKGKEANAQALRDGSADLIVAPTPDGDYYLAQGVASVFADLTTVEGTRKFLGQLFPSNTIFMTRARVEAQPQIARHLARAFVRTLKYINTHTPEQIAANIPDTISGKDRAAYLQVLKQEIPMFANDGRMPKAGAAGEFRVLATFEPKYKDVDVGKTYTDAFVDAALAAQH
jgi:NitT/TauT family transport system substrate-binding protein